MPSDEREEGIEHAKIKVLQALANRLSMENIPMSMKPASQDSQMSWQSGYEAGFQAGLKQGFSLGQSQLSQQPFVHKQQQQQQHHFPAGTDNFRIPSFPQAARPMSTSSQVTPNLENNFHGNFQIPSFPGAWSISASPRTMTDVEKINNNNFAELSSAFQMFDNDYNWK